MEALSAGGFNSGRLLRPGWSLATNHTDKPERVITLSALRDEPEPPAPTDQEPS